MRTWEVVWRGDAGCAVLGCCFLPSAPDVLAVCCPEDNIRLFDTSAAEPAPAVERAGIGSLWSSAAKPRQLLCIAAAADGSALAASGNVTVFGLIATARVSLWTSLAKVPHGA